MKISHQVFYIVCLFIIGLLISSNAYAEEVLLPSEQEVNVEEFGTEESKTHILWLPSERGISGELQKTVLAISKQNNYHILMPDWHGSYFIEPSRSSLDKIPAEDYKSLIKHYVSKYQKLYIAADSRAASIVLKIAHQLQTENKELQVNKIAGLILISPYLQKQTPEIGKSIEYQEIAKHSNLPIYIFQPERSPRFVPLPRLIEALELGGSQIYKHTLGGVSGGFHARDIKDLTPTDTEAKIKFPKQIKNAISMLQISEIAPLKPLDNYENITTKRHQNALKKVSLETPSMELNDLDGNPHNLENYRNKIVVVSFWASWCRPCIEEMPSLVKLKQKYKDELEILAVNVREENNIINAFTQSMGINFPILKDTESATTEAWKVYVYPSNFIVDKKGKLRYAATGAMDWQDPEIEAIIDSLNQ